MLVLYYVFIVGEGTSKVRTIICQRLMGMIILYMQTLMIDILVYVFTGQIHLMEVGGIKPKTGEQ